MGWSIRMRIACEPLSPHEILGWQHRARDCGPLISPLSLAATQSSDPDVPRTSHINQGNRRTLEVRKLHSLDQQHSAGREHAVPSTHPLAMESLTVISEAPEIRMASDERRSDSATESDVFVRFEDERPDGVQTHSIHRRLSSSSTRRGGLTRNGRVSPGDSRESSRSTEPRRPLSHRRSSHASQRHLMTARWTLRHADARGQ